ncbi:DUF4262 domain-containing protein [Glutamicibacter creatinolyticus]
MKEVIHKSAIKPKNTLARVNTGKAGEANTIQGVRTMCMMCDGMSAAEVEAHINGQIAQNGYAVYCIQDPNPKRVFGYTVGLTRLGQPEFLVRGISEEDTLIMLNGLARQVLRGEYYDHGHTADWKDGRLMYFALKTGAGKYTLGVHRRYGLVARVLEVHLMKHGGPVRKAPNEAA